MSSITQNDITNALTSAVKIVADSSAQSQNSTLTIEAKIIEIIDEGIGVYKVQYLGNKFEATTAHTEITYQIGDIVYVIIPNGDFNKNKIILSPVNPSTATYATIGNKVSYITIGNNLFKSVEDVFLSTYKPHDYSHGTVLVDTTGFNSLFEAALTDSRTFNFTCKVRTNIDKSRRSRGNYGIKLDIPVIQEINGEKNHSYYSVIMDINNISGDAYNLSVPTLQNIYFTLPEDMSYDNTGSKPAIYSFVKDFIGSDISQPNDIFITDIQLLSTLANNVETMSGYYGLITASNGNSFLASRFSDTKTLTANIYFNGKLTNISNFDCYWFKENVLINNSSEKFLNFGGLGWEILNDFSSKSINDDGRITYQYITNAYTHTISQSEIHCDTRFKCVLVKDDKVITSIITIKNLASQASIELTSTSGFTTFPIGIGTVELQLKYYEKDITDKITPQCTIGYAWQRLDKKGNYIDNDFYTINEFNNKINNTYITKISYPVSEIDEANTIGCTVYIDTLDDILGVKRQIIGTVWLTITTGSFSGGRVVLTNGDKIYKYDADGDAPNVADYDGPLTSAIKTIDPIFVTLFKEDGTEFTSNEYAVTTITWLVPINSMIRLSDNQKTDVISNPGYYTISGSYEANSALNYNILNTYNKTKINNDIIVRAVAPSSILKQEISGVANIRFLKDGESGTNGSKYSAIITYNNYGYGEKDINNNVCKLQIVYITSEGAWYFYNSATREYTKTSPSLKANLYVDGELYSNTPNVEWKIFDSDYNNDNIISPIEINKNNGNITFNRTGWSSSSILCSTIEAKIAAKTNATQDSDTKSAEYIYAYYPIECTCIPNRYFRPTLEGGFSKVLYASDGTNPQYDNSEPFYIVDTLYNNNVDTIYNYAWESSTNIKISNYNRNIALCKATPTSKYDNGKAKNYVKVSYRYNPQKTSEIMADLIEERDETFSRKNYYQTLQNNIDFFQNFEYNNYINILTSAADYYVLKTNLTKTIELMLERAKNVQYLVQKYGDNKTKNINTQIKNRIEKINNLAINCAKLGVENVRNNIISILPSSLVVNTIIYSNNDTNNNYFSINDAINIYNNLILKVYQSYYNELQTTNIQNKDSVVRGVMNNINNFVNNSKWNSLITNGEESYRYNGLYNTLRERLNTAKKQLDTYSYTLIIENVINPIYDSISWYINFVSQGGYSLLISELNNKYNDLINEINSLQHIESNSNITHIKPIIMLYNRYEMSNLNGWDGNKLIVDTDKGYIISPQIGAGIKNNDNSFTGIVMGVKKVSNQTSLSQQKIGLFGYTQGKQSIFLNAENGSATFGVSGEGQVIIDPSERTAIIKSGNYSALTGKGMQINLTTPEIRFGSGNFYVDSNGHITAKGGGEIAGWKINDTQIYKDNQDNLLYIDSGTTSFYSGNGINSLHDSIDSLNKGFYLGKDGFSITGKSNNGTSRFEVNISDDPKIYSGGHDVLDSKAKGFYLSQDGFSICNGPSSRIAISTTGDPELYSGGHNELSSITDGFYLGNNGLSIGSKVYINKTGLLRLGSGAVAESTTSKYWTINGNSSNSFISYGTTDKGFTTSDGDITIDNSSKDGQVYLGTDGIRLGKQFAVDDNGNAYIAGTVQAKKGKIGNWEIENGILKGVEDNNCNIKLDANGSISGGKSDGNQWKINRNGTATFNHITASGGSIGNWSISNGSISKGSTILTSNGEIECDNLTCRGGNIGGCTFDDGNIVIPIDKLYITNDDIQGTGEKQVNWRKQTIVPKLPDTKTLTVVTGVDFETHSVTRETIKCFDNVAFQSPVKVCLLAGSTGA